MNAIELQLNAWMGSRVDGKVARGAKWALQPAIEAPPTFLAPRPIANPWDWQHPSVGWGVIARDGAAIPPALDELRNRRSYGGKPAPLFRFLPDSKYAYVLLRNYEAGKDIDMNSAPRGIAPDALPQFVLIYGSPDAVPWRLQYILNANRCVGRLDLEGSALQNYVNALMNGWKEESSARPDRAVVWAVVDDPGDITGIMRTTIAARVAASLQGDADIGAKLQFIDGLSASADSAQLVRAVRDQSPGLIVTTSHGQTGPLEDREAMERKLGALVDQNHETLDGEKLLAEWQPSGAIWYAHACCSAGGDARSNFADLFAPDTTARQVLDAVAGLGSRVAPLPRALLGVERPLRAFIGHVEPTFDWTLRQQATGQFLTSSLADALYTRLYQPYPVGFAFREWYARIGGLNTSYESSRIKFNDGEDNVDMLLSLQLAARDIQSTVILGDPTVALPPLRS